MSHNQSVRGGSGLNRSLSNSNCKMHSRSSPRLGIAAQHNSKKYASNFNKDNGKNS